VECPGNLDVWRGHGAYLHHPSLAFGYVNQLGSLLLASDNSPARILQNRSFVEPGVTYFQGVLRGCPFRRRRPNPVKIPETRRHPARRLCRGQGVRLYPGHAGGPDPPAPAKRPNGQPAGRVKILQKAAVDPIRGSGISSSLSLISVICYLLSRPDPRVPKIIPLRPTPAYPPYGRHTIC
jgi:hypothetical protein